MTRIRPPEYEVVFVPGYADMTARMVDKLATLQHEKPFCRLPADMFESLVAGAREWLEKARAVEADAANGGYALQTYKAYCDSARQCCYTSRDVWHRDKGREMSATQASRRREKPSADPDDRSRNERLRKMHARLKASGNRDATAQVASEFDLSDSQVRRIVAAQR